MNGKKDSVISIINNESKALNKDNLDIKSYISQSRSDIGQFDYGANIEIMRGGSYRSQYGRSPSRDIPYLQRTGSSRSRRGRSPNLDEFEPTERARSATVSASNLQRPNKRSLDVSSRLSSIVALDDNVNNSRKDSGIRSNSRRSSASIQQVGFQLVIVQHPHYHIYL